MTVRSSSWFLRTTLAILLCTTTPSAAYNGPWDDGYSYQRRIPRDVMVGVINNLGLALLEVHSDRNDNNVAISPYGATSVLVALVEGLVGDAAQEIKYAIHLPEELAVVRVGLRDIHRHLKSYFIPKEGFLAGLTLSHDNITLNREYESILRFYGYDVDSFNNPVYPEPSTTTTKFGTTRMVTTTDESATASTIIPSTVTAEITTNLPTTTEISEAERRTTTETVNASTENLSSLKPERTTRKNEETTKLPDPATEVGSTTKKLPTRDTTNTESTEDIMKAETKYTTPPMEMMTTEKNREMINTTPNIILSDESKTETTSTTTEITTQNNKDTKYTTVSSEKDETEVITVVTSMDKTTEMLTTTKSHDKITLAEDNTIQNEVESNEISSTTIKLETTTQSIAPQTIALSTQMMVESTESGSTTSEENSDEILSTSEVNVITSLSPEITTNFGTTDQPEGTKEPVEDTTTEIVTTQVTTDLSDLIDEASNMFEIKANITPNQNLKLPKREKRSVVDYLIARYYDNYYISSNRRYLPQPQYPNYQPTTPYTFLVNGKYREPNISFMTYDTVLPFYYIPGLDAMALSFPLDSNMYYLLLVLPTDEQGIENLVRNFRKVTTLERIVQNLKYTHVKAVIPSFMLKGYVVLTPSLQKLCIRKIFEPRHADFSQLTPEKDIYVTNIEQAVTVTIRNYMDPSNSSGRNLQPYRAVEFMADHPFLYFVMDSQIHVNLMAGKIVNPLNSRIR